eukprot:5526102-Amphidinium_carterae.1
MALECKLTRSWQDDLPSRNLRLLVNYAIRALRLVSRHCSPAHSAALARLLFSYRAMPRLSDHRCCWCEGNFHLSRELHVVIQTGCYRRPLARLKGFSWLENAPPLVLFQLLASTVNDDIRKLGRLAATLVESIHRARYGRHNPDDGRSSIVQAAIAFRARHYGTS